MELGGGDVNAVLMATGAVAEPSNDVSSPADDLPLAPRCCDLVMKGGITSGIVYPSAVIEIGKRYWFSRIGGASAGAIAAALTAVAELARRPKGSTEPPRTTPGEPLPPLPALAETIDQLSKPGFLLSLFQPSRGTRPFFQVFLLFLDKDRPVWNRALGAIGVMLSYVWWALVIGLMLTISYAVIYTQGIVFGLPHVTAEALAVVSWAAVTFWIIALCMLLRARRTTEPSPRRRRLLAGLGVAGSVAAGVLLTWLLALQPPLSSGIDGRLEAVSGFFIGVAVVAAFAGTAVTWALVCSVAVLAPRAKKELERNGFGMCKGMKVDEDGPDAVTEWLHERIQSAAGRSITDDPVTFAELERAGIGLEMITTDLSYGRPLRLPLEDGEGPESGYFFDAEEWLQWFPAKVVDWMVDRKPASDGSPVKSWDPEGSVESRPNMHVLPGKEMPILVGARLSLSFPGLISAVPVYSRKPYSQNQRTCEPVPHWFSDGGISSNFPIHFFDGWLPRHPTFGLTLPPQQPGEPEVVMPRWDEPVPVRWTEVNGLVGFVHQIVDTMQNWRDNAQADLAGYRERICHIRMKPEEGGANVNMPPDVINALMDRGDLAGRKIVEQFDHAAWRQHVTNRYISLVNQVHEGMNDVRETFGEEVRFGDFLEAGAPQAKTNRKPDWPEKAAAATEALIEAGAHCDAFVGNDDDPKPQPTMRMAPRT